MYKTIFKRMWPTVIGCFSGVLIVAFLLYLSGLEDSFGAVRLATVVFVGSTCAQFFFIRHNVIKERLQMHTVMTPLPIVYLDKKKLYSKPYLDLDLVDKVWGLAVGEIFIMLCDYKEGTNEKFSLEDLKLSLRKKLLSGEILTMWARLPESDELMLIRHDYMKVKATVVLLNIFGVNAEEWKAERYICFDDVTDYDADDFFEKGEQVEKQAFSINMSQDKNPNKMELPPSACAYVRLVAK